MKRIYLPPEENLVTDLVPAKHVEQKLIELRCPLPSEIACLASSPGRMRRTLV
jgi:hypothetical protein